MIDYAKVLDTFYKGAEWSLNGDTYDGLVWLDTSPKPTQTELDELWAHIAGHPEPLQGTPLAATLNAVLGIWSLQDAANIAQLPEQALIDEAQAWAAAGGNP